MTAEGPAVAELVHWLAECPPLFLEEPVIGREGRVLTAAVVSDALRDLGHAPLRPAEVAPFQAASRKGRNRLRTIAVACWLLHHEALRSRAGAALGARRFLISGLDELSELVDAPKWVSDPDRREELARLCLSALDLRPAGETEAQAQDRRTTLDTVARRRVMQESRAAQERVRKIQEEMRRKAAEEAAARYTGE